MKLSIFWRLVLTCLVIIVVMGGVNLYALFQLRQLTAISTEMASFHYPAVEAAKRLQESLFAQLNSEKKYLATKDGTFLTNYNEEVEEFERNLQHLRGRESASQAFTLLQKTEKCSRSGWSFSMTNSRPQRGDPAALRRMRIVEMPSWIGCLRRFKVISMCMKLG